MRRITWLGHATVLIEAGGARLLTDPLLRDRIAYLRRQVAPPADPGQLDGVLISHVHHDHLDRSSLRRVAGPDVALVLPAGAARLLSRIRFGAVHEVSPGDTQDVGGARVEAVPAWHDGRRLRGPWAKEQPALGFLTDGVWFAGDTELHPDMEALKGRVDVALLPIWGWGFSLGPGHMDPEEAAAAVALIRPRLAVPIHYGTFAPIGAAARHRRRVGDPARNFAARVSQAAPDVAVRVLAPGESLFSQAMALARLGRYEEAIIKLQQVDGTEPQIQAWLGILRAIRGGSLEGEAAAFSKLERDGLSALAFRAE